MIELIDVSKSYGKQSIFQHANYTFSNHGLYCLLGPSGCGKSTLLHMIAGFGLIVTFMVKLSYLITQLKP